jgi:hypothetical protein
MDTLALAIARELASVHDDGMTDEEQLEVAQDAMYGLLRDVGSVIAALEKAIGAEQWRQGEAANKRFRERMAETAAATEGGDHV